MPDDGDKKSYGVGFGRTPEATRFKKGQSGNPKGRPKGAKNIATILDNELSQRVDVTEQGRKRRISKRELIVKRIVNKGAEGDLKASVIVLNEERAREDQTRLAVPGEEALQRPEDEATIEGIFARWRAGLLEEPPAAPAANGAAPPESQLANSTDGEAGEERGEPTTSPLEEEKHQ